jgi:hypothetical protein
MSEGQRPSRRIEPISTTLRNRLALDPQSPDPVSSSPRRASGRRRVALSAAQPRPSCNTPLSAALLPVPPPLAATAFKVADCRSPARPCLFSQQLSAAVQGKGRNQQVTEDGVGDGDDEQVQFYLYHVIEISSLIVD